MAQQKNKDKVVIHRKLILKIRPEFSSTGK
jgi:hypothetical protein